MKQLLTKYRSLPIQARASLWFLICTILQRSISIITTPIFTRLLSTDEYGQYSVFLSWMGILTCFVTMYIYQGVYSQTIVKYDQERNQYSSGMQGLTLSLVLVWLCIYLLFASFWNSLFSLNTAQMLAMFIVMWANAIFGFWSAEQRVEYRYKKLVIVTLVEAVFQPVFCIVLIHICDEKVTGLVWGIAAATLICYIYLLIKQFIKGKVFYSKKIWSYALKLAIPLIPHYISSVLLNSSDRIMIQKLVGDGQAGIYNLAYTVSICGTLINQAVLQTLSPWIYQKIKAGRAQDIKKVAYPSLIAIAGVNLLIILFTPEIISIFGPSSYYEAIWVMPPISMSVFFMYMYNLFSAFEFYYEKTVFVSTATLIGAISNVILNYLFIRVFGYYAAGYTTLFCYMLFCFMHYLFMQKICKKEMGSNAYNVRIIVLISIAFLASGFVLMLTFNSPYIRYGIVIIALIIGIINRKRIVLRIGYIFGRKKT